MKAVTSWKRHKSSCLYMAIYSVYPVISQGAQGHKSTLAVHSHLPVPLRALTLRNSLYTYISSQVYICHLTTNHKTNNKTEETRKQPRTQTRKHDKGNGNGNKNNNRNNSYNCNCNGHNYDNRNSNSNNHNKTTQHQHNTEHTTQTPILDKENTFLY